MQRRTCSAVLGLGLASLIFSAPAAAAIQLQQVLTGLNSPLFVTHAGDGSNRLFIVERPGTIQVLAPGAGSPSVFLNITTRVLSGSERGLLGLAFHPAYAINGRFFVYYTRQTDGAIRLSEFRVTSNPNVADPNSEIPLLTIPHPNNTNHNGGMIAFGPDGYLYAGPGDGGGSNDPPNNAQNINVLLGKILRIDVDTPNGSIPYSSPADNPFAGATPGADEIFAVGMRNPWRWSFDRGGTGQLYCGDVGQGVYEEIDIITNGGNYGWRVYEGLHCTNLDPGLCNPANYIMPIAEYSHASGRCSITGGYIYRGFRGTLPVSAYLYADYCTGEIFQLNPAATGGVQTLLLDSPYLLASFGEDEAGELYAVDIRTSPNGKLARITSNPAPAACTYAIAPSSTNVGVSGGTGGFDLTTGVDCGWLAVSHASWITVTSAGAGAGNATINFSVAPNPGAARSGFIQVGGQTFTINQGAGASITAWRSVRSHSGVGPLAIALDPARSGNGTSGPTVETRAGGILRIEVDFATPVTLLNGGDVTMTGRTTVDGVLGSPLPYVPATVALADADTVAISFAADALPNATCYTIALGPTLLAEGIAGDADVNVRSLVGDTTMNGAVELGDALDTKARVTTGTLASASPQHDVNLSGGPINLGDALQVKSRVTSPTTQALCP